MATMYEADLHDVGMSTFQSIQLSGMREIQAKSLNDEADGLEQSAAALARGPKQKALMQRAGRLRAAAARAINGDWEGTVNSQPLDETLSDDPTAEIKAQVAKLEEQAKSAPEAMKVALLQTASSLRQTLNGATPAPTLRDRWNGLSTTKKVATGVGALALLWAGHKWWTSS